MEAEQLQRDQSLVMVHAEHSVKLPIGRTPENRIGTERTGKGAVRIRGVEQRHGGFDKTLLFVAQISLLAGMWIEARNSDAWSYDSPLLQESREQSSHPDDLRSGEQIGHILQGHMSRNQGHGEWASCQ